MSLIRQDLVFRYEYVFVYQNCYVDGKELQKYCTLEIHSRVFSLLSTILSLHSKKSYNSSPFCNNSHKVYTYWY